MRKMGKDISFFYWSLMKLCLEKRGHKIIYNTISFFFNYKGICMYTRGTPNSEQLSLESGRIGKLVLYILANVFN